jgi:hypothetical protein
VVCPSASTPIALVRSAAILSEWPSVEQQHAAGEPVAKIDLAIVQEPAQDREPLRIAKRCTGRQPIVPSDLEMADHARALQPLQKRSDPPSIHRAAGDPLVDEVLPKAG